MTLAETLRVARTRVAAMGREELRTRLGQEAAKRVDLVRYRLGLRRWVERPGASAGRGRFFFDPADVPGIIRSIKDRLPARADEIVQQANAICLHRISILGYSALDYGPDIDWHRDPVHGKRAKRRAWYKIDFLDFQSAGDHKLIWELNRHQHLVTLAKAWLLTGDRRYIDELVAQWYSWQRANPYPLGINWASSLEAGFRSLSWIWIRELLASCSGGVPTAAHSPRGLLTAVCPPAFATDLARGLAVHARYIERNLSTYFSPNTHLIGEAAALFFIGTLCPGMRDAARWRDTGWRILTAEAARQVLPDGVHFEQSLHYHVYALDFFLHARQLAVANGVKIPDDFEQTILSMMEVIRALAQAAPPEGFGDDDGGRLFDPRRNRAEFMTDPLSIGAALFARSDFKAAAGLTEEAIWLVSPDDLRVFDALGDCPPSAECKAFDAGGIYVMAAPGGRLPGQMAIDAGPQGAGRSGHGHADALSVRLGIGARRWLIDPGTFRYVGDPAERDRFRGTAAHNTLRVDEQDQAIPQGPFAWGAIPSVQVERWLPGITFALFAGNHTGYGRLPDPVLHRRFVLQISTGAGADDLFWLVRDVAEGHDVHHLEVFWHFGDDASIAWTGDAFVASVPHVDGSEQTLAPQLASITSPRQRLTANTSERSHLTLLAARDTGWSRELTSGYVSPAYGVKQEAPLVRFVTRARLPAECATLILPGAARPAYSFDRLAADPQAEQRPVSAYRYQDSNVRREFLFAEADDAWTFGPWTSDARLVYASFEGGEAAHLVLVDGSFAEVEGKSLARYGSKLRRLEWVKVGGEVQTFRSADGDEAG